jgi:hypothetical protein
MFDRRWLLAVLACPLLVAPAPPARATAHLWRITEVFSNAAGDVQFIELHEITGDDRETHLNEFGMYLRSIDKTWYFPADLNGPTGHKWMLVATPAFAARPGAPTPDYILDEDLLPGFFQPTFDILQFRNALNEFSTARLFPGTLPLDGYHSLNFPTDGGDPFVAPNSPTNFAGDTATLPVATEQATISKVKSRYEEEDR